MDSFCLVPLVSSIVGGDDQDADVSGSVAGPGCPSGWLLAHRAGTSSTGKGSTAATNDAGILMAPDASSFVVVVFIAESNASDKDRHADRREVASGRGVYWSVGACC